MDAGHLLTKMPRIVSFDKETVNVKLILPRNYKSTLIRREYVFVNTHLQVYMHKKIIRPMPDPCNDSRRSLVSHKLPEHSHHH